MPQRNTYLREGIEEEENVRVLWEQGAHFNAGRLPVYGYGGS